MAIDKNTMDKADTNAKRILTTLNANSTNGMFTITNKTDNDIWVLLAINKEIPTAPPSIKPLGNKNPFNPNPAEITPIKIKKESFKRSFIKVKNL